jgi:thymidine phosphorylase
VQRAEVLKPSRFCRPGQHGPGDRLHALAARMARFVNGWSTRGGKRCEGREALSNAAEGGGGGLRIPEWIMAQGGRHPLHRQSGRPWRCARAGRVLPKLPGYITHMDAERIGKPRWRWRRSGKKRRPIDHLSGILLHRNLGTMRRRAARSPAAHIDKKLLDDAAPNSTGGHTDRTNRKSSR